MKSAKAWPSIEGCGWMLMLKAEGLKLYSQRVSMNGRWRVSVTWTDGVDKNKQLTLLTDCTWLDETGETGPKMPATPALISSHSFRLACINVNGLDCALLVRGKGGGRVVRVGKVMMIAMMVMMVMMVMTMMMTKGYLEAIIGRVGGHHLAHSRSTQGHPATNVLFHCLPRRNQRNEKIYIW